MPAKKTFTSIRVRGNAQFDSDLTNRGRAVMGSHIAYIEEVPNYANLTAAFTTSVGKAPIVGDGIVSFNLDTGTQFCAFLKDLDWVVLEGFLA